MQSNHVSSLRLFKYEKYYILTLELYHPVKSFDEKLNMCETCQGHFYKNEIPCQAFRNKMALDPIQGELKDFKKLEEDLISRGVLFKNIVIIHGKGEFSKIKESICNINIEAANICNILPRPAVSNGLIAIKLKQDIKYRGHVYFEPVRPHIRFFEIS